MTASAPIDRPPPQRAPNDAVTPPLVPNYSSCAAATASADFCDDPSAEMDWDPADVDEAAALADAYNPATLLSDLAAVSSDVWGVDELRDGQKRVGLRLLDPTKSKAVLAVAPTGSGKTHIVRCIGPMLGGVVLYFVPLLALSADILLKFSDADQSFGTIQAFNLDELYKNARGKYGELLSLVRGMTMITTSTNFVFLSPHFLVNHSDARNMFIGACASGVVSVVVVDEVHLFVQQGLTFRNEILDLRDIFFRPVFHPSGGARVPYALGMSGTVPWGYDVDVSSIMTVKFTKDNTVRSSADEFAQREIHMRVRICNPGDYVKLGLGDVVDFLRNDASKSVVLFCNSRSLALKLTQSLESKLNSALLSNADVLVVHGKQSLTDKIYRTRIFCEEGGGEELEDMSFRCLIGTSAINVGIDKRKVARQKRCEFPRDLPTLFQERSRGSREKGAASTWTGYFDLASLQYLRQQLYQSRADGEGEMPVNVERIGFNSMVTPLKVKAARLADRPKQLPSYTSRAQNKKNRARARQELNDVLSFIGLNRGCMHCRSEVYLHSGVLDKEEAGVSLVDGRSPCVTQCAICTGEWDEYFLPVSKKHVREFFRSGAGREYPMTVCPKIAVSHHLWVDGYWKEKIFDRKSRVKRVNVDALFISLIAAGMIDIERSREQLRWNLIRDGNDQPIVDDDNKWGGINTFPSNYVLKCTDSMEEYNAKKKATLKKKKSKASKKNSGSSKK